MDDICDAIFALKPNKAYTPCTHNSIVFHRNANGWYLTLNIFSLELALALALPPVMQKKQSSNIFAMFERNSWNIKY